MAVSATLQGAEPLGIQDPLSSPRRFYTDPYDVSTDTEAGAASLGTIDETSAAGFSTYDRAHAGPSQDRERNASLDYDAYSTYPPISEESSEAKRVQQNLERWGAEEKMRRKAQRTSKIAAARTPSSTTRSTSNGFHQASDGFGSGPSSELLTDGARASPGGAYSVSTLKGASESTANHAFARRSSVSSVDSGQSLASGGSDERPNRKLPPIGTRVFARTSQGASLSGVREESRDPFGDPTDLGDKFSNKPKSRVSMKPTASRPIVTVGRASSMQRQALQPTYTGKGKGRSMPTIVATDTEDARQTQGLRIRSGDPFIDDTSFDTEASTTLHQGGLGEEVAMDLEGQRRRTHSGDLGEADLADGMKPSRASTSSSRFRELGVHVADDWTGQRERPDAVEPKKPWWTDLLCGCGTSYDDDEQAGRTNPME